MTQRVPLPTTEDIVAAIDAVARENAGRPPAALAVATRLGMSNATFWRHFRHIAQELSDRRRDASRKVQSEVPEGADVDYRGTISRLRIENARLLNDMMIAAAEVQRLTLENHALRIQQEQTSGVTPIRPHR